MVKTFTRRGRGLYRELVAHRRIIRVLSDTGAWWVALVLATALRFGFSLEEIDIPQTVAAFVMVAGVQLVIGSWEGLYLGRFGFGSFEEVPALVRSVGVTGIVATMVVAVSHPIPVSVPITGACFALTFMSGSRYLWRRTLELSRRPAETGERLLVVGAGEGGHQMVTALLRNPASPYYPVVIVDDDPFKAHLRIRGVRVRGTRNDIPSLTRETGATTMLIAIPSAPAELVRELSAIGADVGLQVKVLPPVDELFDGRVGVGDIRPLSEADLLGRREIRTDLEEIAQYLQGKRVLVTGAGGSIGSELCRQVHTFGPSELIMLDRDESALHAVELSMQGRALLDDRNLVVADIRDRDRLMEIFETYRPQVVMHAAALKHLPLLQMHPSEALKTNVWGTQYLLDLATEYGVERFVNISTDKAADPTSVLGYTKRLTERLTAYADRRSAGAFISVRFGNVLGSRGSVLTTFRHQVEAGGPITVTHAEVTRYFMTVEEAVQLVVQAGAIGAGGDVLVLDMGEPVKIAEVARRMAEQAERNIDIVYTGLRPGEKLHEVLLGPDETVAETTHPLINRMASLPVDPAALFALDPYAEPDKLVATMADLSGPGQGTGFAVDVDLT